MSVKTRNTRIAYLRNRRSFQNEPIICEGSFSICVFSRSITSANRGTNVNSRDTATFEIRVANQIRRIFLSLPYIIIELKQVLLFPYFYNTSNWTH